MSSTMAEAEGPAGSPNGCTPTPTFTIPEIIGPGSGASSSVSLKDRRGIGSGTLRLDGGSMSPGSTTPLRTGVDPLLGSTRPTPTAASRSPESFRMRLMMDVSALEAPAMGDSNDEGSDANNEATDAHAQFYLDTSSDSDLDIDSSKVTSPPDLHARSSTTYEPCCTPQRHNDGLSNTNDSTIQARFRGWAPTGLGAKLEAQLLLDDDTSHHTTFWGPPVNGASSNTSLELALPEAVRLLSYNVLAMRYVKTDKYPHCPPWSFADDYRAASIAKEIWGSGAHVIALQELSADMYVKDGLLGDLLRSPSRGEVLITPLTKTRVHAPTTPPLATTDNIFNLDRGKKTDGSKSHKTTIRTRPLSLDVGDIHTVESQGHYEDDDNPSLEPAPSYPWVGHREYRSVFLPVTDREGKTIKHCLVDSEFSVTSEPQTTASTATAQSASSRSERGWGYRASVPTANSSSSMTTPTSPVCSDGAVKTCRGDIEGVSLFFDQNRFVPISEGPPIPATFWRDVAVSITDAGMRGVTIEQQGSDTTSPVYFIAVRNNADLQGDTTPTTGDISKLLLKSHNVALLLPLWCLETKSVMLFMTTHLYWDSHKPEVQVLFLHSMLKAAKVIQKVVSGIDVTFIRTSSSPHQRQHTSVGSQDLPQPSAFQGSPALAALHQRRSSPESTVVSRGDGPMFTANTPLMAGDTSIHFQPVLLGDLNSTSHEPAVQYLMKGVTEFGKQSTPQWSSAMSEAALSILKSRAGTEITPTSTFAVRSPFTFTAPLAEYLMAHPSHITAVNPSKGFSGTAIDHILVGVCDGGSPSWCTLGCARLKKSGHMPSKRIPSDHLPVGSIVAPRLALHSRFNISASAPELTLPHSHPAVHSDGEEDILKKLLSH